VPLYPNFLGPSYTAQSPIADGERTMNWYPEPAEVAGQSGPMALYPTPGVTSLATASDSPGRAMAAIKDRTFAVIGRTLFEISSTYVLTNRNASVPMVDDGKPATISWNGDGGNELFITSGNYGYLFNLGTNTFSEVRDPASDGGSSVGAHLNGYFIALDSETSTIYISDLLDGATWQATQKAQRSIESDPWVSMAVLNRQLWLLGSRTSEVWFDAGEVPFPFVPHPSGLVQYGCAAVFSPVVTGTTLLWLTTTSDGTGQVVETTDFDPQVVSSFPVAKSISGYGTISDAVGDSYMQLGHRFYVLTFPTEQSTWVYDATRDMQLTTQQRWTERGTWISKDNQFQAWRPLFSTYQNNEILVLDRTNDKLYRLDHTVGTDVEDRVIRRLRRPPALFQDNAVLRVGTFELFLEPGLGTETGDGVNPQVSMRISGDGGKTFGNEHLAGAGAIGKFGARTRWLRCGSGRRWMPEIVCTDPIPWRLLGASVSVQDDTTRASAESG
jgi:hypothetical protein